MDVAQNKMALEPLPFKDDGVTNFVQSDLVGYEPEVY